MTVEPDLSEYAKRPEHGHWETFDAHLEGARFNRLHELVQQPTFDDAARAKAEVLIGMLEELAHGKGYGDSDSYYYSIQGLSEEQIESDAYTASLKQAFDEYEEDQYFVDIRKSVFKLKEVSATTEARELCHLIESRMETKYMAGRAAERGENADYVPEPSRPKFG